MEERLCVNCMYCCDNCEDGDFVCPDNGLACDCYKGISKIEGKVIDHVLEVVDKELCELADSVCKDMSNKKDEEMARVLISMATVRAKRSILELKEDEPITFTPVTNAKEA